MLKIGWPEGLKKNILGGRMEEDKGLSSIR